MNDAIKQRRVRMLSLIARGVKEQTASEAVAKELNQKVYAVKKDWRRRHKWLPNFINADTKTALQEIVGSMKELLTQAWLTYTDAPSGTAVKVAAYRELRQTVHDMAEIFQSCGIVMKMPEQVEVSHVNETRLILERYQSIETVIRRIEGRSVSEDDSEQQVHPAQANEQADGVPALSGC